MEARAALSVALNAFSVDAIEELQREVERTRMLSQDNHAMVQMSNDNRALRQEVDQMVDDEQWILRRNMELQDLGAAKDRHIDVLRRTIDTLNHQIEVRDALANQTSSDIDRLCQVNRNKETLLDMYRELIDSRDSYIKALKKKLMKRKSVSGRRQLLLKVEQARQRRQQ